MRSMLIQVVRWVTQPKIWRFVCFISSVVGLLCYALSSSFNHLFGNWNFFKVLVYSIFSFIICLAVLFANKWQNLNTSLPLKAHLVFSVFIITTVYSFFFDKANGKPDLYSLISSAAFSIMSLSLSKQTHFGFEVDLLYFFCGYLTLQLMKIKLVLVIVGGSFSYSLIIFRFYLGKPRESGSHLGLQIQDQTHIVIQVHQDSEQSSTGQVRVYETNTAFERAEIGPHINIDAQQEDRDLGFVTHINLSSQKGKHVVEYISLDDCKKELVEMNQKLNRVIWKLLTKTRKKVFPDSDIWEIIMKDMGMRDIMNDLLKTVKKMMESGFQTECFNLYNIFRSKFLNKCLCRLGLHEVNAWDVENENIGNLISAYHTALGILFPNERKIRKHIFAGLSLDHSIFTLLEWRRIESELWVKFMLLHSRIPYNFMPEPYVWCGVHPLTRGVMNCITDASKDKDNIAYFHIPSIIELLERTLDAKSKNFLNPAYGYLFMLNNIRTIQLVVRRNKHLQPLLGKDWLQLQTSKVRQSMRDYLRSSWNKVLNLMENNESMAPDDAVESMSLFHLHFSNICSPQFLCVGVDNKLKETIKRSLKKMVLPLYEKFIGRFKDALGEDVATQHIKYGMSDIEDQLDYLFDVLRESELKKLRQPWRRSVEWSGYRKLVKEPKLRKK